MAQIRRATEASNYVGGDDRFYNGRCIMSKAVASASQNTRCTVEFVDWDELYEAAPGSSLIDDGCGLIVESTRFRSSHPHQED